MKALEGSAQYIIKTVYYTGNYSELKFTRRQGRSHLQSRHIGF